MTTACKLKGSTIGATWAKQIEADHKDKLLSLLDAKYEALNNKYWKTIVQNCGDPAAPTAASWLWDKSHPSVC